MTIKEIAKALKLSTTTVSICLAGRESEPKYCIRPEKAELVRAFARKHGYVPDISAQRLRNGGGVPPVGIVFSHGSGFEKSFPAIRKAMDILSEKGREYYVIGYHTAFLSKALETLRGMRVKEVIAFGPFHEPCPVYYPRSMIRPDAASARKVDDWLADCDRCAVLLKEMTMYVTNYRFPRPVSGGIKEGMVRMGADLLKFIPEVLGKIKHSGMGPVATVRWNASEENLVPEILDSRELIFDVSHMGNHYEEGRKLVDKLLAVRKRHYFRSIFIGNDGVAAGVIAELCDRGFSVPEDIAVLGCGNDEPSSCCRVPLSTFNCYIEEYTDIAVNAILNGDRLPPDICRNFGYIERESFIFPKQV